MKLFILSLVLLISGCFATTKPDAIMPPQEKVVHIDPYNLEPCLPIIRLEEGSNELEVSIKNIEIYADCKNRQNNSIILLKKFSNYKEVGNDN